MRLNCIAIANSRVAAKRASARLTSRAGVVFAIFLLGCQSLSPGKLDAVTAVSTIPRSGNVYLVRGWRDLWSSGMDSLAAELRASGVNAQVFRASQWKELANAINLKSKGSSAPEPLVLIGFSYGADDVIEIARRLKRPVDLLITIDPVTPPPVPANVRRCQNFFQTNGLWDIFPWLRGIPLKSDDPARLINVDIRKNRPDLLEPNTAHSNIADNPKLHREIITTILSACPLHPTTTPIQSPPL